MNLASIPQHVIQKVNFDFKCFYKLDDLEYYLKCLKEISSKKNVSVHAYALMRDHVHLLVSADDGTGVPEMMSLLGQHYTEYYNRRYCRKGELWENRIRPCLLDAENYLLACQRYVELSPVRAGLVSHPAEYIWSSYSVNALGEHSEFLKPHAVYEALGANKAHRMETYRQMFSNDLEPGLVDRIDEHFNYGYCLGSEQFKLEIASLLGRRDMPESVSAKSGSLQLRSVLYH